MSGVPSFVATAHRDVPPAPSILSKITGYFVSFQMCRHMAVFHMLSPRPPLPGLDWLGLSARTSRPPFVCERSTLSSWIICCPRPTPKWASEETQFPPLEIFDIMQDSRCNWNSMEAALTPPNRRTQKCMARQRDPHFTVDSVFFTRLTFSSYYHPPVLHNFIAHSW